MADNLPDPASRKESYLAKAAGMDVTIPESPESRVEQYLEAIAEGGGGGGSSYTAGDGITIADDTISVDTTTIQEKLTAGTGIDITNNTISATGGGGPTVVQTTGTSTTDVMSQDATTKMLYPDITNMSGSILIGTGTISANYNLGINGNIQVASNRRGCIAISGDPNYPAGITNKNIGDTIVIGTDAYSAMGSGNISLGRSAISTGSISSSWNVAIGYTATTDLHNECVALGSEARCSRDGEVNIGTGYSTNHGYNASGYRVLGGLYDGQLAHDAVTVNQVNAVIDAINTALSTSIPHIGA